MSLIRKASITCLGALTCVSAAVILNSLLALVLIGFLPMIPFAYGLAKKKPYLTFLGLGGMIGISLLHLSVHLEIHPSQIIETLFFAQVAAVVLWVIEKVREDK